MARPDRLGVYRTVLVCLGLDHRDQHLVATAGSIAEVVGARRILLQHVYPHEPLPWEMTGKPAVPGESPAVGTVNMWVRELAAALPRVKVAGLHGIGQPYEEVVRTERKEDVDLVVIGREPAAVEIQGQRGRAILRYTASSALVVPEGTSVRTRVGLVGLDFSQTSTEALLVACRLCEKVIAVYSYQVEVGISYGGLTSDDFAHRLVENARLHFESDVVPKLPPGTTVPELRVLEGARASDTLLQVAREVNADLVVLGSHGQTRIAALFLGSTAERLTQRSPIPVLVVRRKGDRRGLLESLIHR